MPSGTAATAIIVNPNARGGWVGRKWPTLEPQLREELGAFTPRFTRAPGEGRALAREALRAGAGLVLSLGGDGTASEVAAAFLEGERPAAASFGYLPCGTGGDLRRTHGSPPGLREAARAIAAATPRPIDAGQLDCVGHDGRPVRTYFINVASCGIGGLVDSLVNRSGKLLGGTATFFSASLRASLRYKNAPCLVRLDEGPAQEVRIYNLAVANGRYFGGGMQVAPEARVDDGLFDVVTMGDLTFLDALLLGGHIYKGTHLRRPKISVARARVVKAEPRDPGDVVLLDVDGETAGRLPATFTVLPGALLLRA